MNRAEQYCQTIKRMSLNNGGDNDTVLLLRLDGDVSDISPNRYTAAITGTVSYTTGYLSGTQAIIISNPSHVTYDNIVSLPGDFSLDFFANYYTSINELYWGYYWLHPSTPAWRQYSGLGVSSQLRESIKGKTPTVLFDPINLNTWYHIAITRENGTIRMFKNGVLAGSGTPALKDAGLRFDVGYTNFNESRITYYQNIKLTKSVRHNESGGVYTFPVPTQLYNN